MLIDMVGDRVAEEKVDEKMVGRLLSDEVEFLQGTVWQGDEALHHEGG